MSNIREIATFISDGDWIESNDQSNYGIRLVQTGNIGNGEYLDKPDKAKYISEETCSRLNCTDVYEGDILISRLPDPIGRSCIVPQDIGRAITAVDCTILRVNHNIYNPQFFVYYTQTDLYKSRLSHYLTGTTRKRISRKNLENIVVPQYPKKEQDIIVNKLDMITNLISLRKQQLKNFDMLVKSRFLEMFGMSEGIDKHLEDVADICSGITKGRKVLGLELREVPYMAVSNVKMGYIDLSTVKTIMATENEIEQYRLFPNDILVTEGGDPDKVGRGAIIRNPPKDYIHQNHIFRVRLHKDVLLPEFFEEYLQGNSARRYFLKAAKQTTGIASINMKQLRALPVKIPPIKVQIQYSDFVHQVDKSKYGGTIFLRLLEDICICCNI